jgi:hypothetical protein
LNRYAYVANNPLSLTDPTGEWPTSIHNDILTNSFPGLSSDQIGILEAASAYVDRPGNQGPGGANSHGQCPPTQSLYACDVSINSIITGGIGTAQQLGYNDFGLWALGAAIHTFTDTTSPFHSDANGTPTCWLCDPFETEAHILGEDVVARILGSHMFGAEISQAELNARAAFATAFPQQYGAAVAGANVQALNVAYSGLVMATGSVNPSQVLQNEVSGCLLGNPATCPDGGDAIFQGFMGFQGIGGGGFPNQFVPRHIK